MKTKANNGMNGVLRNRFKLTQDAGHGERYGNERECHTQSTLLPNWTGQITAVWIRSATKDGDGEVYVKICLYMIQQYDERIQHSKVKENVRP